MGPLQASTKQLEEIIHVERHCGIVTVEVIPVAPQASDVDACNTVVRHVGFNPPGVWVKLPIDAARRHLVRCLHQDLAYSLECIPKLRSEELADTFLRIFCHEMARYFTNTYPWEPLLYGRAKEAAQTGIMDIAEADEKELPWGQTGGSWVSTGLSSSTFDSGLVVIDASHVGIMWFQDED